jgi:hypothetical protein
MAALKKVGQEYRVCGGCLDVLSPEGKYDSTKGKKRCQCPRMKQHVGEPLYQLYTCFGKSMRPSEPSWEIRIKPEGGIWNPNISTIACYGACAHVAGKARKNMDYLPHVVQFIEYIDKSGCFTNRETTPQEDENKVLVIRRECAFCEVGQPSMECPNVQRIMEEERIEDEEAALVAENSIQNEKKLRLEMAQLHKERMREWAATAAVAQLQEAAEQKKREQEQFLQLERQQTIDLAKGDMFYFLIGRMWRLSTKAFVDKVTRSSNQSLVALLSLGTNLGRDELGMIMSFIRVPKWVSDRIAADRRDFHRVLTQELCEEIELKPARDRGEIPCIECAKMVDLFDDAEKTYKDADKEYDDFHNRPNSSYSGESSGYEERRREARIVLTFKKNPRCGNVACYYYTK